MSIRVLGIDHVVLRVRDLERAMAFYCGVLGCEEERRVENIGLVQLRAGRALIDLVEVAAEGGGGGAPDGGGRNMDHVALRLAEFDEAALRAHLEAHGVRPAKVGQRYGAEGDGPSMYITDPDGNTVELKGPPQR